MSGGSEIILTYRLLHCPKQLRAIKNEAPLMILAICEQANLQMWAYTESVHKLRLI